jgi:hypothetical protein
MTDKQHLEAMLTALDASPRALERRCGDWQIAGNSGHIMTDGRGFLLYVSTSESPRPLDRHQNVMSKRFCKLTVTLFAHPARFSLIRDKIEGATRSPSLSMEVVVRSVRKGQAPRARAREASGIFDANFAGDATMRPSMSLGDTSFPARLLSILRRSPRPRCRPLMTTAR